MLVYIVLRELLADYGTYYLILLGVLAIVIMLKAPMGIWGWVIHRYDLQLFPVGRRLRLEPTDSRPSDRSTACRLASPREQNVTAQEIVERARALAPRFAERALAAEEARRIPQESAKDMLRRRFRPHPAAARDRRLRSRFRHLVRGDAGAQQGRCVARLVRRPDHSPRPPDRAVPAGRPKSGLGGQPRCADCGVIRAEREGRRRPTAAIGSRAPVRPLPAASITAPGSCSAA